VDQELTAGRHITDGTAVLFVTFLNAFTGLFEIIVPICLQKRNFLSFQYLILFVSNRSVANSVLSRPLPKHSVRDLGALYLLFGYVAEHKPAVHYHLLNLFATVSPIEELRIVFALAPITGTHSAQAPKEPLGLSEAHGFDRSTAEAAFSGRRPRLPAVLEIGGAIGVSSRDRPAQKLSPFRGRSVSIDPAPPLGLSKVHLDVADIAGGPRIPALRMWDVRLALASVVMTIICVFVVFYFLMFA
jgi:hypothetical protein